jgi:hypothetical protein
MMAIPGQFSVAWSQDADTGVHTVKYGEEQHSFSISEEAFEEYTSMCRHSVTCAGWILDPQE